LVKQHNPLLPKRAHQLREPRRVFRELNRLPKMPLNKHHRQAQKHQVPLATLLAKLAKLPKALRSRLARPPMMLLRRPRAFQRKLAESR